MSDMYPGMGVLEASDTHLKLMILWQLAILVDVEEMGRLDVFPEEQLRGFAEFARRTLGLAP